MTLIKLNECISYSQVTYLIVLSELIVYKLGHLIYISKVFVVFC